ncbi:hypothetical protein [Bacillus mycoides]
MWQGSYIFISKLNNFIITLHEQKAKENRSIVNIQPEMKQVLKRLYV